MDLVLFVTNPSRQCGVAEFGASTAAALQRSTRYRFQSLALPETTTAEEFLDQVARLEPGTILYNWHPATMPWLNDDLTNEVRRRHPGIRQGSLIHDDVPALAALSAIIFPDPTYVEHGICYKVGRLIPAGPTPTQPAGADPVIGTFGFGTHGKGFPRIIEQVNAEFDRATVRLHLPHAYYCDSSGSEVEKIVAQCRELAKPGIRIEASHDYKSREELVRWLAENTVNCFFYEDLGTRGVSSVIDHALTARRPIAITQSHMFRHVRGATPAITIERTSLREIIANGLAPLQPFYSAWTPENLVADYERIVARMREPVSVDLTGNRVLTAQDREAFTPVVRELHELCPDIMSRKFRGAVFQNAYNFQQARTLARKEDHIILIGGFEDPIGPALKKLGHDVTITDPDIDGRDMLAVWRDTRRSGERFDMVVSCSVLEHVEDDFLFVWQMYHILKPGGVALLTTDFHAAWSPGSPKPAPDVRFYTIARLKQLASLLPPGSLIDPPRWVPTEPYFKYEGIPYCFCALSFRNVDHLAHQPTPERDLLGVLAEQASQRIVRVQEASNVLAEQAAQRLVRMQEQVERANVVVAEKDRQIAVGKGMIEGIGPRSLRVSLGVARRVSRMARKIRGVGSRKEEG